MFLTQIDLILFFISQTESSDRPHVITRLNSGIRKFTQTQTPTKKLKSGSSMFSSQEFKFGIIWNDFSSSTIWETQIEILFNVLRNPKNPGIHPSDDDR